MKITAIETRYAGCRFRSRLEARWAVFFDHLGIRWEYEPQGYLVGADRRGYLPDFALPDIRCLVEVKGDAARLDIGRLASTVADASPYMLIILGPVPRVDSEAAPVHSVLVPHLDVDLAWHAERRAAGIRQPIQLQLITFRESAEHGAIPMQVGPSLRPEPLGEILDPPPISWITHDPVVEAAYVAARSARFEHGESGAAHARLEAISARWDAADREADARAVRRGDAHA